MILKKNRKMYTILIFCLIIAVIVAQNLILAKAVNVTPDLTIDYIGTNKTTSSTVNGTVNEEFTANYMVKPNDIPFSTLNPVTSKEIVLVLDTSGSMNWTISDSDQTIRIEALKNAAKTFVNKFKDQDNVKIGIANYSQYANYNNLSLGLNSSKTDNQKLVDKINSYKMSTYSDSSMTHKTNDGNIEGGTNTGDGIRTALGMLKTGSSTAKKYVILMSDGEPTLYTAKPIYEDRQVWYQDRYGSWYEVSLSDIVNNKYRANQVWYDNSWHYLSDIVKYDYCTDFIYDSNLLKYLGGANNDNDGRSMEYASLMASKIKENNYTSYEIAYSVGSSADKMSSIAKTAGGKFFTANDSNSINNLYSDIADQIKNTYVVSGANLNFTLPNGLEYTGSTVGVSINGSTYTQKLPDIVYTLSDDKTKYTANSFPIKFTFRASKNGNYSIGGAGWNISYKDINGNLVTKQLPQISYSAPELPIINGRITGQDKPVNPANKTDPITLSCQVTPEKFIFDGTTLEQSGPKDVIFVIDTSVAMRDRILGVKNGLFDKIAGNNQLGDVKYGIVTFDSTIKDNYISGGLTNDRSILQSKIFSISTSNETVRNIGDAMEHAKTIFSNSGRSNSSKYMILIAADNVQYTTQQFDDIIKSNFNIVTVNLGYVEPPQKVNDTVIPGADEPKNNIKDLHYSFTGKQDKGDNVLQKEDNNYFININYNNVTNKNDPNDFFEKYENWNQMNDVNQFQNWIPGLVADKIKSGTVEVKPQTYTFKTKLRFKLQGKFDNADLTELNSSTDANYDVETPEFDVVYNFNSSTGYYEPAPNMFTKTFKVKIKPDVSTDNLQFGPGVVSYVGLGDNPMTTDISPYLLMISAQIAKFGEYNGMLNNQPNILESGQPFIVDIGGTVKLGATITGLLNTSTDVSLDIQNGIVIGGTIDVYSYDDKGNLSSNPIGKMTQSSSDSSKTTYKYSLSNSTYNNLLIVYNEGLKNEVDPNTIYTNNLYTKDQSKSVQIQMNNSLQIKDFGLYKGIVNKEPSILASDQPFSIAKGANVMLGATLVGSISNDTNVKLEIQNGIKLNDTINVYSYDINGNLTQIGTMKQVSLDSTKATYKYDGEPALNAKILLVYSEHIDSNVDSDKVYVNTLYTPDGNHKEVKIKVTSELPDLF